MIKIEQIWKKIHIMPYVPQKAVSHRYFKIHILYINLEHFFCNFGLFFIEVSTSHVAGGILITKNETERVQPA